jgi:hypothetical protein
MYKESLFQVNTTFSIEKEVMYWNEQQERLEQTEGWERLTEKQQNMLRASFRIQSRAYRGTDEASFSRISHQKGIRAIEEESPNVPAENMYRFSQNVVSRMFCHLAVTLVEKERLPDRDLIEKYFFNERDSLPIKEWKEYFSVEWKKIAHIYDLIKDNTFPLVLYFDKYEESEIQNKEHIRSYATHSCIAMGEENGDILIWEKVSRRFPFQLTKLQTILERYPFVTHCAVRPLGKNTKT